MSRRHGRTSRERGDANLSLVRFLIGETQYAFEVAMVREVVNRAEVTVLPHLPFAVEGVADHRGTVVPIIDLRMHFGTQGVPSKSVRRPEKWILVDSPFGLVGFLVDRVLDVLGTDQSLAPAPSVGGPAQKRGIRGVINVKEGLLFVLDPTSLSSIVGDLELDDEGSSEARRA